MRLWLHAGRQEILIKKKADRPRARWSLQSEILAVRKGAASECHEQSNRWRPNLRDCPSQLASDQILAAVLTGNVPFFVALV